MILVTGGLGYIGSHTVVELINSGKKVVIVDNLSNTNINVLKNIEKIVNQKILYYNIDLKDKVKLEKVFKDNDITGIIHFAGFKAVGESVEKPIMYYENNLVTTLNILSLMEKYDVKNIIFSSSATVYGQPKTIPVYEEFDTGYTNPYGGTKLFIEKILNDVALAHKDWGIIILRYFNPIGSHKTGLLGEEPNGIPNNIMPYILKVATGELSHVNVFGDDYDTVDGTGVRDYIHVVDLAEGHVKALEKLDKVNGGKYIYNLGTGKGTSVLELINAFKKASALDVPYVITERRSGDVDTVFANADKAFKELGWKPKFNIDDMCISVYNYYLKKQEENN